MRVSDRHEVIIIGGGIVGCSTAFHLAKRDVDCVVIDRGKIGQEATTASAGVLSHPNFLSDEASLNSSNSHSYLSKCSYHFYDSLIDDLKNYTDQGIGYDRCGSWYLGFNEKDMSELSSYFTEMKKYNRDVEWFESDEIRNAIPSINGEVKGGYFYNEEAKVNPIKLHGAISQAAKTEGVEFIEECMVQKIVTADGTVERIETEEGSLAGDNVLLSAGAWSSSFEDDLGVDIPVEPRKGVMISIQHEDLNRPGMVWHGDRFVMVRDQNLIVGSTVHNSGFDKTCQLDAIHDLLDSALTLFPALKDANLQDYWAGLRPYAARKGGPFLGGIPGYEDVFIAAGHYKTGILQGPFSGLLMSKLILGEEPPIDVSHYRLDR